MMKENVEKVSNSVGFDQRQKKITIQKCGSSEYSTKNVTVKLC